MSRKYFSWTDEKRAELREYVNTHSDIKQAFKEAAVAFGVSKDACIAAYHYEPKRSIVNEVDPSELEPRKERVMNDTIKTVIQPEEKPIHVECEVDIINVNHDYQIRYIGDHLLINIEGTVILLNVKKSTQSGFTVIDTNV